MQYPPVHAIDAIERRSGRAYARPMDKNIAVVCLWPVLRQLTGNAVQGRT
jgi:hypothetical protein